MSRSKGELFTIGTLGPITIGVEKAYGLRERVPGNLLPNPSEPTNYALVPRRGGDHFKVTSVVIVDKETGEQVGNPLNLEKGTGPLLKHKAALEAARRVIIDPKGVPVFKINRADLALAA